MTSDLDVDEAARIDVVWRVLRPTFAEFGIGAGADSITDYHTALRSREVRAHFRSQVVAITHLLDHYSAVEDEIDVLIDALGAELAP